MKLDTDIYHILVYVLTKFEGNRMSIYHSDKKNDVIGRKIESFLLPTGMEMNPPRDDVNPPQDGPTAKRTHHEAKPPCHEPSTKRIHHETKPSRDEPTKNRRAFEANQV
ncbi:MAG: hypothetical protein BYD32DRAFT_27129 [Podila humilis]|nr:MAG: hypothetical protein BYD32DRAFT_27129 [Podila humilis]